MAKKEKIATESGNEPPDEVKKAMQSVEKACEVIEETLALNNIPAQIAISAMASIMTTTLSQYTDARHFYSVLTSMDQAFQLRRKQEGREL